MAYEPTDRELAEYIARRLGSLGERIVEPEFIAEVMANTATRDLWLLLYQVDNDPEGIDPDDPRFAAPS